MTRDGGVMTGIIMAGRTGAAFAAQLGTMQVNEEIDALQTMGIPPMEFLVLPRMLALMLMMPLLCVYADMMGMLAGLLIGTGLLDLSVVEYVNETRKAVHLVDFGLGLGKSVVFGALVALAGCLRGMQCGRSASAVGPRRPPPWSRALSGSSPPMGCLRSLPSDSASNGQGASSYATTGTAHYDQRSDHGLREFRDSTRPEFQHPARKSSSLWAAAAVARVRCCAISSGSCRPPKARCGMMARASGRPPETASA